jgi:hypothetical protein
MPPGTSPVPAERKPARSGVVDVRSFRSDLESLAMKSSLSQLVLALSVGAASSVVQAGPIGIDGTIGAEWTGISVVNVTHDPLAPTSNFGAPGPTTAGASYSIRVRGDGSYVYVALQITGNAGSSAGNFANLYFDTSPGTGSDLGIEVTNGTYFIPGGASGFNAAPYVTYDATTVAGTIELAIDNSFFTSGLQASPAATSQVQLRLSQSFGYSVAGGATYGADRLGIASILPAASVPEPGSLAIATLALGGLFGLRRPATRRA